MQLSCVCGGSGAVTLDKNPPGSNGWFAHISSYGILVQFTYSNMLLITDFEFFVRTQNAKSMLIEN